MSVVRPVRLRAALFLSAAIGLGAGVLVASAQITPVTSASLPAGESVVAPGAPAWISVTTGGLALLTGSVPAVISSQPKLPTTVNSSSTTLATGPSSLGDLVYRFTLALITAPPLTEVELTLAIGGTVLHPIVYFATGSVSLTGTLTLLVPLGAGPAPTPLGSITLLLNVCGGSCP